MCAMVKFVVDGKSFTFTVKLATAAVIAFELSRVIVSVMVTVPLPVFSALAIGGTSLAGSSLAVNVVTLFGEFCTGAALLLQPASARPAAITRTGIPLMIVTPLLE